MEDARMMISLLRARGARVLLTRVALCIGGPLLLAYDRMLRELTASDVA